MKKHKEELQIGEIVTITRIIKPTVITGIVYMNSESMLQLMKVNNSITIWNTYTKEILNIDSKNINVKDLLLPAIKRNK